MGDVGENGANRPFGPTLRLLGSGAREFVPARRTGIVPARRHRPMGRGTLGRDREASTVSSYTITITPDDASNPSAILHVGLDESGVRSKELTLRAGEGGDFTPATLAGFPVMTLIGAFGSEEVELTEAAPVVAAQPPRIPRPRGRSASVAVSGRQRSPRRARVGRASVAEAAAVGSGSHDGRRAYRRMPDDVVEVYQASGGATALARHYGVPRHTAQGWLRRLRQQGSL
jgi:hypothetical protein